MPGDSARVVGRAAAGFTLIEILVVVVILGILAAVVTTSFANAGTQASQTAFVTNLRTFVDACEYAKMRDGVYPADTSSGVYPPELAESITPGEWVGGTPIGGVWDTELNDSGVSAAVGVHFNGVGETRDDAYMTEVDAIFDDGALATGVFQKLAGGRYYWVLEP